MSGSKHLYTAAPRLKLTATGTASGRIHNASSLLPYASKRFENRDAGSVASSRNHVEQALTTPPCHLQLLNRRFGSQQ
jgi:hypothetical protein